MNMKFKLKDVWYYIQGNVRYQLYYWKFHFYYRKDIFKYLYLLSLHKLIPRYIREQIEKRINSMNPECYKSGSCIKCGCITTQLQMANKSCEGNCYPKMQNRKNWNLLKRNRIIISEKRAWQVRNNKFKQYEVGK